MAKSDSSVNETKFVTLFNLLNQDATIKYGDQHIMIAPRGRSDKLDASKINLSELPTGVKHKSEDDGKQGE